MMFSFLPDSGHYIPEIATLNILEFIHKINLFMALLFISLCDNDRMMGYWIETEELHKFYMKWHKNISKQTNKHVQLGTTFLNLSFSFY